MDTVNTRFKWEEATGEAKYIADRHYEGLLEGAVLPLFLP